MRAKLPERRVDLPAVCSAFALSPDGTKAYWAGNYNRNGQQPTAGFGPYRIVVWDVATGATTVDGRFENGPIGVTRFQFSEDGVRLAMLLGPTISLPTLPPSEISIVDPAPGLHEIVRLKGPGPGFQVRDLAFNAAGTALYGSAFAGNSDDIFRWTLQPPNPTPQDLVGERAYLNKIAVSRDERLAAAAGGDGFVRLWDLGTHALIGKFAEHVGPVSTVTFLGDGQHFVTGGDDGAVVLWDVARLRRPGEFTAWQVPAQGPGAAEIWFAGDEFDAGVA